VFDLLGREVTTLVNERKEVGTYQVTFNALGLASGVYLCRLTIGDPGVYIFSRKMVLMQ